MAPALATKTFADRFTTVRPPSWCNGAGGTSQKGTRMLNQQTNAKLLAMTLHGLADAFRAQETTEATQRGFAERLP